MDAEQGRLVPWSPIGPTRTEGPAQAIGGPLVQRGLTAQQDTPGAGTSAAAKQLPPHPSPFMR
jgi:hypothetical protein